MTGRREFLTETGAMIATLGGGFAGGVIASVKVFAARSTSQVSRRIAVARFAHETNTFHPVPTSSYRFTKASDPELDAWNNADLTIVPGVSASPAGGGTVEQRPCRAAMDKVLASLRDALPVDAVFLRMHGAMYAEGVGPAETVLVGKIRELVGPRVPIACTLDLHGNLPARLGQFSDILVGLKTAPHTDAVPTAELAGKILLDTLRGRVRPVSYVLPIPIIVQGEKAMTTDEPFGSLVEQARRVEREGVAGYPQRILAATLFAGCAWTDSPDTGMSVMITADGSRRAARAAAVYLAQKVWDARRQFDFGCETAELKDGVSRARAAKESTVFLTDSGDNVTASTPGDLPIVLRHLVEHGVKSAIVACINDMAATRQCFAAGEGNTLRLSIGATIERRHGPPLQAEAAVVRLVQKPRMAVIRIGAVEAVLAEQPMTFRNPRDFETCGIDPLSRKMVVVKMGYLYPNLMKIAPRHIMLLTPGAGDMRIERLSYVRRRKPAFPFEPDTPFDPTQSAP